MESSKQNLIFKITPLGGVGEIGSNMTLITTAGQSIIIDSGILFPYEDFFNIEYLIPDLNQIKENIDSIIITHGHEDHIGAIAHIVKAFPSIKIWAPLFATELIRNKLAYQKLSTSINTYNKDDTLQFQDIDIHPIHVNHSIPDTYGLLIQDKKKEFSAFYVSDFKYDDRNPLEPKADFDKLKKLSSKSQVRLLFVDSTNIESENDTVSEFDLVPDIKHLISSATGNIFFTLFSSNILRMQNIINSAHHLKKQVIGVGRSIHYYSGIASNLGFLDQKNKEINDIDNTDLNNKNNVFLVSGCQGEQRGALRRIAAGEHKKIKITENDIVVFSSKIIPGNEKSVFAIYNKITESKGIVITDKDFKVHASGHAGKKDLRLLVDSFRPSDLIPIHGESYMLQKHIFFIKKEFPHINTHLLYNNDSIEINKNASLRLKTNPKTLPTIIHGNHLEISREKISERRKMACNGVVFISIAKQNKTKFAITAKGLPLTATEKEDELLKIISDYTSNHLKKESDEELAENIRIISRRFFSPILGYRPITIVHVIN